MQIYYESLLEKLLTASLCVHALACDEKNGVCEWRKSMKKKVVALVLTALMMASLTTACGGNAQTQTAAPAPAAETEAEAAAEPAPAEETEPETEAETETESEAEPAEESASEDFTLLDVSTDMIDAGVYAVGEGGEELVFSMFTAPSGVPMASLFGFNADGNGDVICGTYTAETETDEDGIDWTLLTVTDAYTGGEFELGFGESDEEVYIFDTFDGTPYEGEYLTADETIDYMGAAVALLEEGAAGGDAADSSASEDFTLLDVSADMIEAGVYAVSDDGTELVFSMFTEPSGTPMASLFIFGTDGEGDVICGPYDAETATDEDGIDWTLLTVTDAYTDGEFEIGFGESDEEVYIFDVDGNPYEGQYLTEDETIVYMGTAAALMEE